MTDPAIADAILALIEAFQRSGMRELHIRQPDFELFLSTDPAAGSNAGATPPAARAMIAEAGAAPPEAPATPAARDGAVAADALLVRAPNLGTFYRAPKPGAAPYVEIGAEIAAGDELCLIEVMKLFTSVRSEMSGRIDAILVEDGAMVEAGEPLFAVVPR